MLLVLLYGDYTKRVLRCFFVIDVRALFNVDDSSSTTDMLAYVGLRSL